MACDTSAGLPSSACTRFTTAAMSNGKEFGSITPWSDSPARGAASTIDTKSESEGTLGRGTLDAEFGADADDCANCPLLASSGGLLTGGAPEPLATVKAGAALSERGVSSATR